MTCTPVFVQLNLHISGGTICDKLMRTLLAPSCPHVYAISPTGAIAGLAHHPTRRLSTVLAKCATLRMTYVDGQTFGGTYVCTYVCRFVRKLHIYWFLSPRGYAMRFEETIVLKWIDFVALEDGRNPANWEQELHKHIGLSLNK